MKSNRLSHLILLSFLFLLGLFCLDRMLYHGGMSLAVSPYWHSEISNRVTHTDNMDILIVGGCRAALHFDSEIIQNKIHLKTFNAGKAAINIGNMEFILNSALAYQKPKYVLIVIDPNNLEETLDTAREDLLKSIPWLSNLKLSEKEYFIERYQLNNPIYKTGFYSFMGKGDELIRTTLKKVINQNLMMQDGYDPRDANQNVTKELANNKKYKNILDSMKKELSPSQFAIETYHNMITAVKKSGAEPIIVMTPMHHLFSKNELNDKVTRAILDISEKEGIQSFIYLDNDSAIAKNDLWWSDTGHLNQLGAEKFTTSFVEDFERYIGQPSSKLNLISLNNMDSKI